MFLGLTTDSPVMMSDTFRTVDISEQLRRRLGELEADVIILDTAPSATVLGVAALPKTVPQVPGS